MSVSENHGVICPKCGQDHSIDVTASVDVRLFPDGATMEDAFDGSMVWDDASPAQCQACGHVGTVKTFREANKTVPTWTCPDTPQSPGDEFIGCGQTFRAIPDESGWVICPHCGFDMDTEAHKAVEPESPEKAALRAIIAAFDEPHYGDIDAQRDSLFDVIEPARSLL